MDWVKYKRRFDTFYYIDKDTGCWQWIGDIGKRYNDGYGRFFINGKSYRAHRVSYLIYIGDIPKDIVLDHLCRNRSCVNPYHLEPVTSIENIRRGYSISTKNKNKTHCINGHELSGENIRMYRGKRICRVCDRERKRVCLVRQG